MQENMMDFTNQIPPHNLIAEKQVLSSMLLNDDTLFNMIADLRSEHFYNVSHAQIFNAMKTYKTKDVAVLSLHVSEPESIFELMEIGAFRDCSESVHQLKAMLSRREGLKACLRSAMALQNDFETTPDKVLNEAQSKIAEICIGDARSQPEPISAILPRVFGNMQDMHERRKSPQGFINTGIDKLDSFLVFDNSDLIVIGGRPGMGKSAFVSHIMRHNSKKGKTGLFFSCEMSKEQEAKRELFAESELNMHQYNLGYTAKRDIPKLCFAAGPLSERKIWIDSYPNTTPSMVIAKCNYVKSIAGLDFIIFDYLQLSGSDQHYRSRQEEVSYLARAYKAIAMQFNVPFFLLSQLGRSVEDTETKKPEMRHLKESGGIEENANTILFLYREYKYWPESKQESKNKTTVICRKQRDGEADIETDIYSDMSIGKYADLETIQPAQEAQDNGCDRF